jgi:hypothetical protein
VIGLAAAALAAIPGTDEAEETAVEHSTAAPELLAH